ncbi:hypothetical protein GCM10008014_01370 [Paenibacillus silvae]|uniref:Zinc ribbon domain-containing protein n=1 Tax=Paenibacillus silvae TaxID=1325358 RepID=A0ABQ1YYV9_9BACL|nr:hypothetical protein [Paenibacillus silvae]GGH41696.1 hypothetical protein GCM10008014_01370 [Paenibacillus silvae]
MLRKFFGFILMIYAIGIPIAFFTSGNYKLIKSDPFGVTLVFIMEFVFIFFTIKLLKKKRAPQRQFYGGDDPVGSEREHDNGYNYSSYNSNTVNYTSNQSFSYTEININSDRSDEQEAKVEAQEPPRQVSVSCPGCGAKVKVYRKQSADCDYCGTAVEAS